MLVPFAAFSPLVIITAMFGVTSGALSFLQTRRNDNKPPRYSQDMWDTCMQDRDERLTGSRRGQLQQAIAPSFFSTNSKIPYESPVNRLKL
ncbi:hypothetical protein DSO57_1030780 [Entomophthora muscae]|uniref:Uncharacterized protein n=1 Tax=Entomophthora muscae TaxID=34485 RepID=A0ACC2UKW4_9FUNG|nr:hypothetical protein DSO57_1030780 [Entomophthora muscae]